MLRRRRVATRRGIRRIAAEEEFGFLALLALLPRIVEIVQRMTRHASYPRSNSGLWHVASMTPGKALLHLDGVLDSSAFYSSGIADSTSNLQHPAGMSVTLDELGTLREQTPRIE